MQGKRVAPDPVIGRVKFTHHLAPQPALLAQHSWMGPLTLLTKTSQRCKVASQNDERIRRKQEMPQSIYLTLAAGRKPQKQQRKG